MDKLWHSSALDNYLIEVPVRVINELVYTLLICEHTIFLVVFENTKIWLSRHEKTLLNDVDEAETQEVERNMHEIGCAIWHQSDYLISCTVSHNLRVHGLSDMLFDKSLVVGLLHVEMLTFSDKWLWESIGHEILVLKKDTEEFLSENREVLLLEELGVDLTQLVKLRVDLIFWNGALVTN